MANQWRRPCLKRVCVVKRKLQTRYRTGVCTKMLGIGSRTFYEKLELRDQIIYANFFKTN